MAADRTESVRPHRLAERHDCTDTIVLSLVDYQALRMEGNVYIAAPGHAVDGVDRLVESRDGFDVLQQV
jgi:hypothetical protein